MFFILDGNCDIIFRESIIPLCKGDAFIVPTKVEHMIKAEFADILISCTPQFNVKNVEFVK